MGFLGVYAAIYDYQPQSEGELEIKEGELLYVLEKSTEDDWWKAKKRAESDEEEEPVGLIPSNYIEEASPTHTAKALYDYSRQTDEEVSFPEDAHLEVFDTSDPDWTLVGVNGEFGFAPSNYIELEEEISAKAPAAPSAPEIEQDDEPAPPTPNSPISAGPAASLARVLGGHTAPVPAARSSLSSPPTTPSLPTRPEYTADASEVEEPGPTLPRRPDSQRVSSPGTSYPSPPQDEPVSPPYNQTAHRTGLENGSISPSGFRMYNVSEMVSAMGKRKKMPTTLGINMATGTIMLSPEKSRDGASQEWPANFLTHYSMESKHVFMELVRPSKSLDLHAGSKETALEIVSLLGELAGVVRAAGIDEVVAAATGTSTQKKGQILYDFMAQGDDEVTVAVGDEVIVLDDANSEEWWLVRRLKNGQEGVVPSSYVEVTETVSLAPSSQTGLNAGRSVIEQNRLEEERLTKEALRADHKRKDQDIRNVEVGPGMTLPDRGSSLSPNKQSQRHKKDGKGDSKSSKPKPDPMKTRTWTDRSNSFKVEAQFIGLSDGKIHLHKVNGVKIAVPIAKMSTEDIEYVEKLAGTSLDEDKPLSDVRRKNRQMNGQAGATIERSKAPEYDWFDFFLKAGVGPHQCERYSQNFNRDSMDESILPEITPETLRTLGLKEGDILRVMKFLDHKYGRTGAGSRMRNVSFAEDGTDGDAGPGGLFTGPGGTLKNNTRKGRPQPTTQTSDVVDPKAFEQSDATAKPAEATATPLAAAPPPEKVKSGFDDDAWEVKQPRQAAVTPAPASASQSQPPPSSAAATQPQAPLTSSAPSQNPVLTGAMAELSLLSPPLQPTAAPQPQQQPQAPPPMIEQPRHTPQPPQSAAAPQQPQATGANPAFFSQLNQQQTGLPQQNFGQAPQLSAQQTGMPQQMPPRQRPQPPQNMNTASLIAPPPRPLSAPQNFPQQNQFGPPPLQPQLTGLPHTAPLQTPMGTSMNEMNQQRFQQQYGQPQLQPQPTGFAQQSQGLGPYSNGVMPQQTGFGQQPLGFQQQQPQFLTGNQQGSPFADPRPNFSPLSAQQTGFGGYQQQQQTGINSMLPPALQPQQTGFQAQQMQPQQTGFQPQQLQPQQTGFQSQQTGVNGFGGQSFGQNTPPVPPLPPMPTQQTAAPLVPQKTGPAPPVRFGAPKKLAPQPTGRKANLAQATPQNPFGF